MFRADIEGLRALAVIEVLLFHFRFDFGAGGFTGVDVFFVISGFLLTAITFDELEKGTFSIAVFYERRLRRIVPALLAVCGVSSILCLFVLLPNDQHDAGNGGLAAVTFTANIYYRRFANDYFDASRIGLQPFLHTWSLAVEAQFYVALPLLCCALRRQSQARRIGTFAALAVLSLAFSIWQLGRDPQAAFYLLPSRAWELLAGGLVSFGFVKTPGKVVGSSILTLLGLGLIIACGLAFSARMSFPGIAALAPCGGAALVLAAGTMNGANRISRCLGIAPLRFLGRISYSLYLWHWPVLVFAGYRYGPVVQTGERVALLGLTFLLALMCWRVVERPFLRRTVLAGRRSLFAGSVAATGAVAALALSVLLAGDNKWAPAVLPAPVLKLADARLDRTGGECWPADIRLGKRPCRFGTADADASILLWGDSFARMWIPALNEIAADHKSAGIAAVLTLCPPMPNVNIDQRPRCSRFNAAVADFLRQQSSIRAVVLAAHWIAFDGYAPGLEQAIVQLLGAGKRIYVVLNPPMPGYDAPRALALALYRGDMTPPALSLSAHVQDDRPTSSVIFALQRKYGFDVIDPASALCQGDSCPLVEDGTSRYSDADHLTSTAARRAAFIFEPVFRE